MRKKREIIEGAFYHITSRTNNKTRVFENRLGRKIMLMTLQDAKEKYRFRLTNFCIMPTHIHLLIEPREGKKLSVILQWLKTHSARRWNAIHGSIDHLWGERYFARPVRSPQEYESIMKYIDQNPVKAGLVTDPAEWKASGAYYKAQNIHDLIDFEFIDRQSYIKLLSPIPSLVSQLLPPAQISYVLKYYSTYAAAISRLYALIPTIPRLGESVFLQQPPVCLHYATGTTDYFINEYDGHDTMYGKVCSSVFPVKTEYRKLSLTELKGNEHLKLDLSWEVSSNLQYVR